MESSLSQLGIAAAHFLAPYSPYLIEAGRVTGRKVLETFGEKGAEAAWQKAQALWAAVRHRFENDAEVNSAAVMVAAKPDDLLRREMFAQVLESRFATDPVFAAEILKILGGTSAVKTVLAERGSWIEDVTMKGSGAGKQEVIARDDSVIKGVWMEENSDEAN